ncbi:MAG TPA: mechanosensitive ion channel family protein [Actinomycetota bacterium]|nr:mechanosensitive ion channel family protein [Actinomycetota bacterium]
MTTPSARAARRSLVRAALAAVVAIVGFALTDLDLGDDKNPSLRGQGIVKVFDKSLDVDEVVGLCGAALFLVAGVVAVRAAARGARVGSEEHVGTRRAATISLLITIVGYALVLLVLLGALGVDTGSLLLGGAITGVVLGIAAQQTLGNFFAGIVLLVVRPFAVGDDVVLRSGPLGGQYEGRVTEIGLFYTDLVTETGAVALPNAGVLAAAIGPGLRDADDTGEDEDSGAPPSQGGAPGP